MNLRLPELQPQDLARSLRANKHFATLLAVLLLVLAAFPGSPARSLLQDIVDDGPAAAPTGGAAPVATLPPASFPGIPGATGTSAPLVLAPPPLIDPADLPPAPPEEPGPVCSTDALADAYDQARLSLSAAIGKPFPGASLRALAAIATGCSDDDPTGPVLDLALEMAALMPPLGLDVIDLPDLPGIDLPLPADTLALLAPLAPAIRDGCSNLATIAVVFIVLPPAFGLPISQSDLVQFLGPATSVCALFDEAAP